VYKLRWIPEDNDVEKKRIQNLCRNNFEKFVMETTVIDSVEADKDDFFEFSSQEQTKADSKSISFKQLGMSQ